MQTMLYGILLFYLVTLIAILVVSVSIVYMSVKLSSKIKSMNFEKYFKNRKL